MVGFDLNVVTDNLPGCCLRTFGSAANDELAAMRKNYLQI